ncbi:50S ribosomal protein L18 [Rickettsiales endosymbiont of Peranema trichophorum]|uniref:50S ribosomal protein L18 n=1 Tax=Rickettsiales endosymbiont of Peranema trichophorum TaxID=2486577 RepID=UPI0010233A5B|nr:50S ribosomal protein L18 [Rickettsiales endosymbiont of Peranema trichophorum]RZI45574.1 50S ribosomal protein L18 [Rickettsiales endosymbiont of Peranema trichophorum]
MLKASFDKRKCRVRIAIARKSRGKFRLSVFRSNKNIYAQIIDDAKGVTLAAASTKNKSFKGPVGVNVKAAAEVGKLIALSALEKGIKEVVFDRGGRIYHGRVKALADAAREHGLKF